MGAALAAAVADGDVRREDVWVVSKLFNTHHVWHGDRTRPHAGLAKTLAELGVEKLDLYLMHWPFAFRQTDLKAIGGLRLADGTPNPQLEMEMEYLDTWGEMIKMKEAASSPTSACATSRSSSCVSWRRGTPTRRLR